jgi:membrane protease YdiL (CAAX protease family)
LLTYAVCPELVRQILLRVHVLDRPPAGEASALDAERRALWVTVFALPLQMTALVGFLRLTSGTRPYQLGLTAHRARQNIVLGCLAFLVSTPAVLTLNLLVSLAYKHWAQGPTLEHPLTRLGQTRLQPIEWGLLVFAAVVAAAVLEELFFRGALQPWFSRRSAGGPLAAAAALAVALLTGSGKEGVRQAIGPVLFVVLLSPGCFLLPSRRARGIFGTALLFGAFHSAVWPTPVALFVLGLGLGWLADRTQSLVAPVVLHGLFNAVACLMLLLGYGHAAEPPNGKDASSAGRRSSPASTSTAVPGCWLPRRT